MTDAPTAAAPSAGQTGETLEFQQIGTAGAMTPIVLLNALLNIVTLTLYRFWARTRVRRYIWSTTLINGDALEYTGTGWEMFRAFLIVTFGLFLPIGAFFFAGQFFLPPDLFLMIVAIAYIPFLVFIYWLLGVAVWLARRYRFSRTTWRGVRFSQVGSANAFSWALIGYALLTMVTLGWYAPAMDMRLTRRLWRETSFGSQAFEIVVPDKGLAGKLYPTYALYWFSFLIGYVAVIAIVAGYGLAQGGEFDPYDPSYIIVLYGAVFAFAIVVSFMGLPYFAARLRREAEILGLGDLRFSLNATALSLFGLVFINLLIVIFTLGFGLPWAQLRTAKYLVKRLRAEGRLDVARIRQSSEATPAGGEGLADAFDIGAI